LFVDDEPIVLRSIDRVVRVSNTKWEARFVNSGQDALALLEAEDFDIIVSDLSMPEMDGVTLLGNVRRRFPHIARLALSGQNAIAESLQAVRTVHQWISKPCDFRALCASIERVSWARSLVDDPALLARTSELASLPTPPKLFLRVNEAIARGAAMPEIVRMIETDPAVVAKLLQLVNSAFFTDAQRVTSVQRAVSLVGTDTIRGLLLGAELFRSGSAATAVAVHSLFVASLARKLAPAAVSGDAFVAGILHDLGELIVGPPKAETPVLHARAGGLLLGLWGIPAEVVTAAAFHHDPARAPTPKEPTLLATAMADALATEIETPGQTSCSEALYAAIGACGQLEKHREIARALWLERPPMP
jgi:HD-like signal output (HDOD) protein/ActR/RegA family two-component response regulator